MLEYITAACSVCLLLFWGQLAKRHSQKWITHARLCRSTLSFLPIFFSFSPFTHTFPFYFMIFFYVAGLAIPSPFSVVFPFLLIYSSLAPVFYILYLFRPPSPVPSVFWGFFLTLISTFSLSSHTSCLCSFFLLYSLPSLSPGSPSSPIFFRRLLLSPSHPSISPTSHPPPSISPTSHPHLHYISLFSSPVSPPLPLLVLSCRVSVSGHKPHTWLIDF